MVATSDTRHNERTIGVVDSATTNHDRAVRGGETVVKPHSPPSNNEFQAHPYTEANHNGGDPIGMKSCDRVIVLHVSVARSHTWLLVVVVRAREVRQTTWRMVELLSPRSPLAGDHGILVPASQRIRAAETLGE